MALTGFDPDLVAASIGKVQTAYTDFMRGWVSDTQSKFVDPMANLWACKDAQDTFSQGVEPSVTEVATGATKCFKSVVEAMNSAARAWAASTDTSYSDVSFEPFTNTLDVSVIKENIGGVRGVDEQSASSTTDSALSAVKSTCDQATSDAIRAVQNCGFVGGSQEANLVSKLTELKNNADDATQTITQSVKQAISITVENYGDIRTKVESAFSGE